MSNELSQGPARRRAATPDLAPGEADGQEQAQPTSSVVPGSQSGLLQPPRVGAVGNQEIQGAVAGGAGGFSRMLAAEMLMANAGFDPTLLGSDSNSAMQQAMMAGGEGGQPGMDQAIASIVGGGPLPEAATNRVETATGGTLGPVSGIPGTQPGVPRHFVDTAQAGIHTADQRSTDARDHQDRDVNDVTQVFGAMASLSENDLDGALAAAGRELMNSLGEEELASAAGGLGGQG